ncbi:hypothetical protein SAMN04244570_0341 [Sporosarcina newyorkensis]|uniref:Uncharacterized protein n=1 Tax=Sporosarcina newyorkensis TaxID=759851 RepID=A0A1T4YZI8_9BACL|nr:hypothetical protein SAMN04244570_0341 [Sporosarcina newyorkensis]
MNFKMVNNKGDNTLLNLLKTEIESKLIVALAAAYFSLYV